MTTITREEWLQKAVDIWRPKFAEVGVELPEKVRISVGWGYGAKAESKHILGECWSRFASADGVNQIFISPILEDAVDVLACLGHELIHAADDNQSGHKGDFKRIAEALGFEGKMTATVPGPVMAAELLLIVESSLPKYSHARLEPAPVTVPVGEGGAEIKPSSGPPKQGTRYLKVHCDQCDYTVRVVRSHLEKGFPYCPNMHQMALA